MAKKRKPRKASIKDPDLLKPVDLSDIGTKGDPCFGKLYDLKATECSMCGDKALCQIAFTQKLNIDRLNIEKESHFKDINLKSKNGIDEKKVKKFYKKKRKTLNRIKAIRETAKQFNLDRKVVKNII